jgi:hypothetical protein
MRDVAQLSARAVPAGLDAKVKQELEPGERLVWMEQPVPRFFTATSTPLFVFAFPWTAFAVFWTLSAAEFKVPDFDRSSLAYFPLFGLPFIAIGIGFLFSPLWAYRKALKTVYVITDRRAITFEGGLAATVASYAPDRLRYLQRKDRANGTGDIVFERQVIPRPRGGSYEKELGFLGVREPRKVEQLLRGLAERGKAGLLSG